MTISSVGCAVGAEGEEDGDAEGALVDLRVAIQRSGVPREELWITSKVKTPVQGGLSQTATSQQVDVILKRKIFKVNSVSVAI